MLRLTCVWRAPALLLALCAPVCSTACGDRALSMGNSSDAGASGGSGPSAGNGGDSSAGSGAAETCPTQACGPELGIANTQCADGSSAGPTGRCLSNGMGMCGWEIRQCPPDGAGGSAGSSGGPSCTMSGQCAAPAVCQLCADGSSSCATADCVNGQCVTTIPPCATSDGGAGAGGAGVGGAGVGGAGAGGGVSCGGSVCGAGQVCCGPAECGHCIPALSGQFCPNICPGDGGAAAGDCALLLADVNSKLLAAQACNTLSASPLAQCQSVVEGLCCPVLIEQAASAPAGAYLAALQTYKDNCAYTCPAVACVQPQLGHCVQASGASMGLCQ